MTPPLDDLGEPRARLSPEIRDALEANRTGFGDAVPAEVFGRRDLVSSAQGILEARRRLTVSGPPGSGTSTLAWLIAQRWTETNPGGRIAVADLADPGRRLHDVVRELLLSLGVALAALPARLEHQTKLLQATITAEDVVILDNVRPDSVADLVMEQLPDAVRVVATGRLRRKLVRLKVPELDPDDSRALLGRRATEPGAASLVGRCAGNPLALHLAARAEGPVDVVDAGGPVEFGLRLALRRVAGATGRSGEFLLGQLRSLTEIGGAADPEAAGAVWAMDEAPAREHLAAWEAAGVFYLDPGRGLALRPALAEAVRRAAPGGERAAFVDLAGRKAAEARPAGIAWLDRHWPAVREAVRRFDGAGEETVSGLRRVAEILNRHPDLLLFDEIAQAAARRRGDLRAETEALGRLALGHYRNGAVDEAEATAGEAVRRARAAGDPVLLAAQLIHASKIALARRRFDQAVSGLEDAVHLARDAGDVPLEIDALLTAADCYRHVRNVEDAASALSRVRHLLADRSPAGDGPGPWTRLARSYQELDLPQDAVDSLAPLLGDGTPSTAAVALELIGEVLRRAGDTGDAARALSGAIERYRAHGDPAGECRSLMALARLTVEDDPLLAASYLSRALDLARESADLSRQARIRNELGNAYAAGGEVGEAMAAFDDSVAAARRLGDLHAVAAGLASRGRLLARLGYSGDARAGVTESLRLFESLEAGQEVAAVSRDLADILITDGSAGEAIELMERAVSQARHAGDLPNELLNVGLLAKAYDLAGHDEDARQARVRARRLASELSRRADATEAVLTIVPGRLATSGAADAVARDLLTLVEQMAPGEPASMPLLLLHWRAAVTAVRTGDARRALHHLDQLIELASDPGADRPEVHRVLIAGYRLRADTMAGGGEHEAARRDLERALSVARRTSTGRPDERTEMLDLYRQLGELMARVGELRAAENYYHSALELAGPEPDREVRAVHQGLGDLAVARGDLDVARTHYRRALDLAEAESDNRRAGLHLRQLGDVARRAGEAAEATILYQRALEVARRAADEATDDPNAVRDLAVTFLGLGQLSRDVGDLEAALGYFKRGLELSEQLAAALPGENVLRSDLNVAHRGLADTYRETADWDSAVRHYEQALAAGESVTAMNPDDVQAARQVSITHDSLAQASADRGRTEAALDHYQQSLEIAERLAAADPGNLLLQRDLLVSHQNLAQVLSTQGAVAQAWQHMRTALGLAERLSAQDPANPDYRALISTLQDRVSGWSG
ncbi:tetratricopeptide repeat protein [Actinoplanes sp. CA-054009]